MKIVKTTLSLIACIIAVLVIISSCKKDGKNQEITARAIIVTREALPPTAVTFQKPFTKLQRGMIENGGYTRITISNITKAN
jgi:hypothetical protein